MAVAAKFRTHSVPVGGAEVGASLFAVFGHRSSPSPRADQWLTSSCVNNGDKESHGVGS
jgi:hypothetical protein